VPRIERSATVEWEGTIARGAGAITADTGAFSALPYSLPSRVGDPDGKTSPEELLAAATAGCFTMSLGSELARDGAPPERLDVHCKIVMDEVAGEGHQIVGAELTVRVDGADVPDETLERAEQSCPFTTLLRKAGAAVTVSRA
jgi:lipoyl-dependent peroxiredoxin